MSYFDVKLSPQLVYHYTVAGSHGLNVPLVYAMQRIQLDTYVEHATVTASGGSVAIGLPSGITLALHGLNADNLQGTQGVIAASGVSLIRPGTGSFDLSGQFKVGYTMSQGVPEIQSFSGRVDGFDAASLWSIDSGLASAKIGNVRVHATGELEMDENGGVAGTLHDIGVSTSTGYVHGTISGDFTLPAMNLFHGGQVPWMPGVVDAVHLGYADGSHVEMTGLAAAVGDIARLAPLALLNDTASNAGDDTFILDIAGNLSSYALIVMTGAGDDRLTLTGGFRADAQLGEGNDRATVLAGAHHIDGGAGIDTVVVAGNRAGYDLQMLATRHVSAKADGTWASLEQVERVQFADGAVALDIDGNAGQAYRLYNAALGRAPDQAGLGFWIGALDHGGTLLGAADGFMRSDEFMSKFGGSVSDAAFITKLYEHVLHRQPDTGGYRYWSDALDAGTARSQLLVDFSESAENKALLIGAIGDGIAYEPFG